ncbi:hypothetical protein ES705_42425 [subsurface metagenome]
MEEKVITVLSKTIKTNRVPDVGGFIQAMKDMGAKVTTKDRTIVIDLRHPRERRPACR